MNIPRKHHYVPQSLLKQFSIRDERKRVFVYDKAKLRSFPSSIADAGAERDFYAAEHNEVHLNFEKAFDELDQLLSTIVTSLNEVESYKQLVELNHAELVAIIATQLLRTQLQRTSPAAIAEQLRSLSAEFGAEPPDVPSDQQSRLLHLRSLLGMTEIANHLVDKEVLVFDAKRASQTFLISDNPVVLHNTMPYGREGLRAPGIEIYLPISSRRCLALFCPSLGQILRESFDPEHPRAETKNPWLRELLDGLESHTIVPVDTNFVQFINSLQVTQSSRFLYRGVNDFTDAATILTQHPEFQQVSTRTHLGKPGEAMRAPRMPDGDYLVFEVGHTHHALHVQLVTNSALKGGIPFVTSDHAKLAQICGGVPYDVVTLYQDGFGMQSLRDVMIERVVESNREYFNVRHKDDGMNAFFASL